MKKIIAILAALVLCFSFAMSAFASDVTMLETKEKSAEKDDWTEAGAVVGHDDSDKLLVDDYDLTDAVDTNDTNKISTQVDLRISNTQVSVCVPMKIALVTDLMGGTIYAPANTAYYIENDSKGQVWVTDVAFKSVDSTYTLVDAAPTSGFDKLYIPFKAGTSVDSYCGATSLTGITDWTIAGATVESGKKRADLGSGTKSGITLTGGTASQLSSKADKAHIFDIEYTISAVEPKTT